MSSATAIPKVELIQSLGSHMVTLGQPNDLRWRAFAFVRKQIGDQVPSTFLKLTSGGGALLAFQMADVEVPSQHDLSEHQQGTLAIVWN